MSEEKELTPNETFISTAIKEYMTQNKSSFVDSAMKGLTDKLADEIKWSGHDIINKQVSEFYKAHVVPEVAEYLIDQKQVLLAGVIEGVDQVCVEIGKAFVDTAKKKMESEWDRKKLFKALFE